MVNKITPVFIQLTYEAALKSFWRIKALKKFLLAIPVNEKFIATWVEGESKRDFLDRLFVELQKTDKGKILIFKIAKCLVEQNDFPDLKNWENSDYKIKEAEEAVNNLNSYLKKQKEELKKEKEIREAQLRDIEENARVNQSQNEILKLKERLEDLIKNIGTQQSGYDFENWFFDLLDYCEIHNRRPYVTNGRQIDGSLTLDGTTYLVELKFTLKQTGSPDIDIFKGKIESKADNTMGVFISMSGYSSQAIKDASGKRTTLVLLDSQHLFMCLTGVMSFNEIISRVRRHVSQTGESFLPSVNF